jgi:hypothetical protein
MSVKVHAVIIPKFCLNSDFLEHQNIIPASRGCQPAGGKLTKEHDEKPDSG